MSELRHVPSSHPVVRAHPEMFEDRKLMSAEETLEAIARLVAKLGAARFTVAERRMAQIIVKELHYRSRDVVSRDHDARYAKAVNQDTEAKYAAIAAAVLADPKRKLRDIGAAFGVTAQLVSRIAIARGARRRIKTTLT